MGEQSHHPADGREAAMRLRLLRREFTTPPRGRPRDGRPQAGSHRPTTPANLNLLDHLARTVAEIDDHLATVAPDAGPAPRDPARVYQHLADNTTHLDRELAFLRDALITRQTLEHALAAGDTLAVRKYACPACSCWGLFWQSGLRKVVCVNRRCPEATDGRTPVWTLQQLAEHHVRSEPARMAT